MKVSVVGAGIMGLSTAWALSKLGHQVTVFEQGSVPNPLGSSYDLHRLIRYPYGAEIGYTRMVFEAYRAWDALWADLGTRLYVETGTLCLASTGGGAWMAESAETLKALGHKPEPLDPKRLALRFPLIDPRGVDGAFYLPTGGLLMADRILETLAEYLPEHGVTIRAKTRVAEIDADRARIVLDDEETVEADALVVTGGPWIARLVPSLAARVTPSRQVTAYVRPPEQLQALWRKSPIILDIDPDTGFYVAPPVVGADIKVGDHHFILKGDPDAKRQAVEADVAALSECCGRRLTGWAGYRLEKMPVCFYTVTPDERFIVEPLAPTCWVMSPCSGHGFKFGALLGSRVAEALHRGTPGDLAAWAAGRTP